MSFPRLLLALPAEIRCGHRAIGVFPVRPFFDPERVAFGNYS
jgi:hypothetical protein